MSITRSQLTDNAVTEEATEAAKKAVGVGKDKAEEAAVDAKDKAKEAKDEAAKKV